MTWQLKTLWKLRLVIIPDVSLLIYAYHAGSPHNGAAAKWWQEAVVGKETVGIPWPVLVAFMRITTSNRIFSSPFTVSEATQTIKSWLRSSNVQPINPGDRHLRIFEDLIGQTNVGGKLSDDAHLAAHAIEYGAVLYTHDRDFKRFSGLKVRYPLDRP